MTSSKITEVTIYESPDKGRTVYARLAGSNTRQLHYQDPQLIKEKRWQEIFSARKTNSALDQVCEQAELLYELSKKT